MFGYIALLLLGVALFPKLGYFITAIGVLFFFFATGFVSAVAPDFVNSVWADWQRNSRLQLRDPEPSMNLTLRRASGIFAMGFAAYMFWLHVLPKL
jgi:hypothetical protein